MICKNNFIYDEKRVCNVNSFLVALYLLSRLINITFIKIAEIEWLDNFILSLIFILSIINNKLDLYFKNVIFIIPFIIFNLLSYLKFGITSYQNESFFKFVAYAMIGIFIADKKVCFRKVFEYMVIIGILIMPQMYNVTPEDDATIKMTFSYSVIPVVISSIVIVLQDGFKHIKSILAYINILIYCIYILPISSRGPIIEIIIFLSGYFIIKNKRKIGKITFLLIDIVLSLIFIINFEKIIYKFQELFLKLNIKMNFIDKLVYLIDKNDLGNGRDVLYELAIEGIELNPLFGRGVSSYKIYTGQDYPHNIFLQVSYEMGIVVCILLMCYLIMVGWKIIFTEGKIDKNVKLFLWFLLSFNMVHLNLSSNFWFESKFWLLIFVSNYYLFGNSIKLKKEIDL